MTTLSEALNARLSSLKAAQSSCRPEFGQLAADRLEDWVGTLESLKFELGSEAGVEVLLLGSSGAGKSTLLNALLDARVAATSSTEACTAAVCEFRVTDGQEFVVRVDFIPESSLRLEIQAFADAYQDDLDDAPPGHKPAPSGPVARKIEALYTETSVRQFYDLLDIDELVLRESVRSFLGSESEEMRFGDALDLRKGLRPYLASDLNLWPLVRGVRVQGPFPGLPTGARLIDLPGLNDPNAAREAITRTYLSEAQFVWVVFNTKRNITKDISDLLETTDLFRRLVMEGRENALTFIGTHADDFDADDDVDRFDLPSDASSADIAAARGRHSEVQLREHMSGLVTDIEKASEISSPLLRSSIDEAPFFMVSAKEYMRLAMKRRSKSAVFESLDDTGIPALRSHLEALVQANGIEQNRRWVASRFQLLEREVALFIRTSNGPGEAQPKGVTAAAAEAHRFLQNELKTVEVDIDVEVSRILGTSTASIRAALDRGVQCTGSLSNEWRRIPWNTLRAACRSGGQYTGATGLTDLPAGVFKSLTEPLTLSWSELFRRDAPSLLGKYRHDLDVAVVLFRGEMLERLVPVHGSHASHTEEHRRQVSEELLAYGAAELSRIEELSRRRSIDVQRDVFSKLQEQIRRAIRPACARAGNESGRGMKDRMVDITSHAARQWAEEHGPSVAAELSASAEFLFESVAQELKSLTAKVEEKATKLTVTVVEEQQRLTGRQRLVRQEWLSTLENAHPRTVNSTT